MKKTWIPKNELICKSGNKHLNSIPQNLQKSKKKKKFFTKIFFYKNKVLKYLVTGVEIAKNENIKKSFVLLLYVWLS